MYHDNRVDRNYLCKLLVVASVAFQELKIRLHKGEKKFKITYIKQRSYTITKGGLTDWGKKLKKSKLNSHLQPSYCNLLFPFLKSLQLNITDLLKIEEAMAIAYEINMEKPWPKQLVFSPFSLLSQVYTTIVHF